MKIVWSEHARSQIREIFEYISRDRPSAADGLLEGFLARVDLLTELPEQGKQLEEGGRSDIRQIVHESYRIVYRIDDDEISILSVRHSRMQDEQPSDDHGETE